MVKQGNHYKDLKGKRFGRLLIINDIGKENEENIIGDFIENDGKSPFQAVIEIEISEHIDLALATLTPREEKVLRMRFGVGEKQDYTLEEVGKVLGIARERVRQIEAKAIRRLKHPDRVMILKDFIID